MHLELVELLRCPVAHAPSVLVAAANTIVSRYITDGMLGCPECGAEYEIRSGVTYFANNRDGIDSGEDARESTTPASAAAEGALRLAAQLGMTEGRDVNVLVGYSVGLVVALRELVAARVFLLNAPDAIAFAQACRDFIAAPAGIAVSTDLSALVPAKFASVAFAAIPSRLLLQQAVQSLRVGGRLVAPAECAVPSELRELVRDDQVWVATRDAVTSPPVSITRR